MDRTIAEAKVTRATFYRHVPAKEDLVVAYLGRIHQYHRAQVDRALAGGKPTADILRYIAQGIADELRRPGFRRCAFINAAAEYPDPDHPIHQAVIGPPGVVPDDDHRPVRHVGQPLAGGTPAGTT